MLNNIKRTLVYYLVITLLCGLLSLIYEYYSHGVYSNYMIYSFVIPLILGVIPFLISLIKQKYYFNSSLEKILHNFAIATLIIGSFLEGIVEIYGTTSNYTSYYLVVGSLFLFTSTFIHFNPNLATKFDK